MQRPVAFVASLLLVGCASTLPLGQQTSSVKLVLDKDLMRQYLWHTQLLPFPNSVTVELAYLAADGSVKKTVLTKDLTQNGVPTAIELGSVPQGKNRVVSLFPVATDPSRVWGFAYRAVFDVSTASTVVNLNWQTTPTGAVMAKLITDQHTRLNEIDYNELQRKIDKLKSDHHLIHYGLIDAVAIATASEQATGSLTNLDFIDTLNPPPFKEPLWLKLGLKGLPEGTGATIKLNDPLSPLQTGLRNGSYLIGPVWPFAKSYGSPISWQLTASAEGYSDKVQDITFNTSTSPEVTLDYGTWRTILPGLTTPRSGMASILSNSLCFYVGGVSTTATGSQIVGTIDSFTPSCKGYISYPAEDCNEPGPTLAYCATANFNSSNYLMGGITGWINGKPTVSKSIQHLTLNITSDVNAVISWDPDLPPSMPRARAYGGAGIIDKKVYLVGGIGETGNLLPEVDIFDTAANVGSIINGVETGKWSTATNLPTPREDLGVCALGGKIYAIGGGVNGVPQGAVECYDPNTQAWTTLAPLPTPRYGLAVTTVNGKIYAIGGVRQIPYHTDILERCKVVEVYDPTTGKWTPRSPLNYARAFASAYALEGASASVSTTTNATSSIYILGGDNGIQIAPIEMLTGINL